MNVVSQYEQRELTTLNKKIPAFKVGDLVVVQVRVKEGERERLQPFEGVVIARRNRGFNSSFTVRKISYGEGVERVFPLYGAVVDSISVKRQGVVRRAKLYYLRELSGRAARIKEKQVRKQGVLKEAIVGDIQTNNESVATTEE